MTQTLEDYWESRVAVHVLHAEHDGDSYRRRIYLTLEDSDCVVEFGAVELDLSTCTDEVRDEILARKVPLGRILTTHGIHTQIDCHQFARITPGREMCAAFRLSPEDVLYGRYASITFNGKHAMALIEVMPPGLEESP